MKASNTANQLRRALMVGLLAAGAGWWSTPALATRSVLLLWDPNPEPDIAGYRIYYGTSSRNYGPPIDVGNVTNGVVSGLQEGVTYYFAATAYNTSGLESDFSNEVSYSVPTNNPPPTLAVPASLSTPKNTSLAISTVQVVDPDGRAGDLLLTLEVSHGTITLSTTAPGGLYPEQIQGNGTRSVMATARRSILNATLTATGGLTYTPDDGYFGADQLRVSVQDTGAPELPVDQKTVPITVQGDELDLWRQAHFPQADLNNRTKEQTLWGDKADPDKDGRDNLMEFALGSDPTTGEALGQRLRSGTVQVGNQQFATVTFLRRKGATAVQYIPEVSSDRTNWVSGSGQVQQLSVTDVDAQFEAVTYQDLTPLAPGQPRFMRLRVVKVTP